MQFYPTHNIRRKTIVEKSIDFGAEEYLLPLDILALHNGTYFISLRCSSCEGVVGRFIKE